MVVAAFNNINWTGPVNKLHSLNRRLEAWWLVVPGLTGGITWIDLTDPSNGNHGMLLNMGSSDWVGASIPGSWGALDFDAINDHVAIPSKDYLSSGSPFTISLRVFVRTMPTSGGDGLFQFQSSNTTSGFVSFLLDQDAATEDYKSINFGGRNAEGWGEQYHPIADISSSLLNVWKMLTITYNGGSTTDVNSFKLYIDGIDEPIKIGNNFGPHGNNNVLGRNGIGGLFFDGQMDDVHIYSRALLADEVFQLYLFSLLGYPGVLNRIPRRLVIPAVAGGIRNPFGGPLVLRNPLGAF